MTAHYRADPAAAGPVPGLIIFPSIFGISPELAEHADEIAATGAIVVVFDPFVRSADPGGFEEGDRERAFKRMGSIDFKRMTADFREVLAALKADPACNGRVVGLGICLGGSFVFNAAADGELEGVATWHGSRMSGVIDRASEVKCPVLMDFGDEDPVAPVEEIEKIRAACAAIDDFRLRVHPGAGHGFSHTGWSGHRPEVMAQARPDLEKMIAALR
jgi:carboxymethylenebutenolidase